MVDEVLARGLASLYLSERMSDIVFHVGDETNSERFPAHRLILSLASPVFDRMFNNNFTEKTAGEIQMEGVDLEAFKSILSFIYTSKITLQSTTHICNVLYLAEKYMLSDSIYEKCNECLANDFTCLNFYEIQKLISLFPLKNKPGGGKLLKRFWQVLSENTERLLQFPAFCKLKSEDVEDILCRDALSITSETMVLNALLSWTKERCLIDNLPPTNKNLRKTMAPMLHLVRFARMSKEEFDQQIEQSDLFSRDEKLQMLKQFENYQVYERVNFITQKVDKNRNPTNLMRDLSLNLLFKEGTCDYQTLLIASSRDIIITDVEFVPVSEKTYLKFAICNMMNETLWQSEYSVSPNEYSVYDSDGVMDGGNPGNRFVPCNRRNFVGVGDAYVKEKTTYKLTSCAVRGKLNVPFYPTCGFKQSLVNNQFLTIVFKTFLTKTVTPMDLEGDPMWTGMLAKLDVDEEIEPIHANSVIRSIKFLV